MDGTSSQEGSTSNPFTFIGGYGVMSEAGDLYFFRRRIYDPIISRFLSKDPIDGIFTKPSSLHPYQYSYNNPIIFIDPSGELSTKDYLWHLPGQMLETVGRASEIPLAGLSGAMVTVSGIVQIGIGGTTFNNQHIKSGESKYYAGIGMMLWPIEKGMVNTWKRIKLRGEYPESLKFSSHFFKKSGIDQESITQTLEWAFLANSAMETYKSVRTLQNSSKIHFNIDTGRWHQPYRNWFVTDVEGCKAHVDGIYAIMDIFSNIPEFTSFPDPDKIINIINEFPEIKNNLPLLFNHINSIVWENKMKY